jgi:acetyltransferase
MSKSEQMQALFNPKGVVVVGASTHPGKFGFVALHNILNSGFEGPIYATNTDEASILGIQTVKDLRAVPSSVVDFAMICVPAIAIPETLIEASRIGVKAVFIVSGGYRESGADGLKSESDLLKLSEELGIVIAGPNGQGFVSTPVRLCSQIVAPYPPAGTIAIASQSGNLLSAFMNLARLHNIGISRGISTGNQTCLAAAEYISYFAEDSATDVIVSYLEGFPSGREFYESIREASKVKPVIVVRGGTSPEGAKAAASHTGSLATDDRIFRGMVKQAGAFLALDPLTAFELAAAFATQPLPAGKNTLVLTSAGGWGVLTADAISNSDLNLLDLPDDLMSSIDEHLPPRWSRNNPIDLAGGETRETIPILIDLVLSHSSVDSLIFLGLGIQGNIARSYMESEFLDEGMRRIVKFHVAQEEMYVDTLIRGSKEQGKPVLVASELGIADPNNPAIKTLRNNNWFCHSSAVGAVTALAALERYSRVRH